MDGRRGREDTDKGRYRRKLAYAKRLCCANILVAIVYFGGDFLLQLLELITRQSARQKL